MSETTEVKKTEEVKVVRLKKGESKSGSSIRRCHCQHFWQDKLHGDKMRVMNRTVKKEGWRCTSCAHHHLV